MRIVWRRQAADDLAAAVDYIAERNPDAALLFYETIREAVERLADFPGLGRPGRVPGTRELVVRRYIVPYTVDTTADRVVVLRVLHGRQQWPERFEGGGAGAHI